MSTSQGNAPGRSCVMFYQSAPLSGEFGMKMLHAQFPFDADAILSKLGVYSRGPRKGLPKGYIHWTKVTEGGWDYRARCVRFPGCSDWDVLEDQNPNSASVYGEVKKDLEREEEAAERAHRIANGVDRPYIERAMAARKQAHEAIRAGDRDDIEYHMFRARNLIKRARLARKGLD